MTSGARSPERGGADRARRRLLGAAAPALLTPLVLRATPAAAEAGALDLAALMALLARSKSGEARFTEERFVAGFDSPLRSSGILSFTAPERFARRTLEPRAESLEVAGNLLTLERSGRKRQMALDAMPELAALLEAVRGTLAGDATALRRHFRVRVGGTAALWTLALEPLDAQLASQVRSVQIAGQGGDMRSVELLLAGGDRSLMLIEPLQRAGGAAEGGAATSAATSAAASTAAAPATRVAPR